MKRYFSIILAIAATVSAQIVPSTGNVRGPTSATDNAVARYDGTTGKLIQNSGVTIDDSGNLTVSGTGTSTFAGNVAVTGTGTNYTAIDTGSFVKFGNNQTSSNLQVGAQGFGGVIQGAQSGSAAYNILAQPYGGNFLIGTDTDAGAKVYSKVTDGTLSFGAAGTTKGIRFAHASTYSTIDGVDSSLSGSYQPLQINGSTVQIATNGGTVAASFSSAQALRLNAYGAGTLTTDSSGNVTATSDERAKNIIGTFTKGLAEVVKLTPKRYTWKQETGLNTTDEVASLTAQDLIAGGIPEAVSTYRTVADLNDDGTPKLDADGKPLTKRIDATYTVSDRAVIAALVNAIKELKAEVDALKAARK